MHRTHRILGRARASRNFVPTLVQGRSLAQLDRRAMAAPMFVLGAPTVGVGGNAWTNGWGLNDPETDTTLGDMGVTVASQLNTDDFFGDGFGVQVTEQVLGGTQITTVAPPDGSAGIAISSSQQTSLVWTAPEFDPNMIAGNNLGSTVGTNADSLGGGDAPVTWGFADSLGGTLPSSVTLSGEFDLTYQSSVLDEAWAGFSINFASAATGVAVVGNSVDGVTVTYPTSSGVQIAGGAPVYTTDGSGNGIESIAVDVHYSIVDTDPGAGEAIAYTSTVNAVATNVGQAEPLGPGDGHESSTLTYTFTENVS